MPLKNDDTSLFLKQLDMRTPQFKRNKDLEALLDELSRYLGPVEALIEKKYEKPETPPLFLVGNPRSGTSLFMQFLSLAGCFAVPTNLLSRFYYAPFLGAKIQELLTNPKYDFKNELGVKKNSVSLASDIGKAEGMLAPSEFFHFWRRFLPRYDPQHLNEDEKRSVDIAGLKQGVASIEAVFGRPFAAKAIILQYNLDLLRDAFPNSLFIYMRRQPKFVMQSIWLARKRFYGDVGVWWSVKPKEYDDLKEMDVYHQIAGQVYYTEKALEGQLFGMQAHRKLVIDYETFCAEPKAIALSITRKYADLGFPITMNLDGVSQLEASGQIKITATDIERLERAYEAFQTHHELRHPSGEWP